MLASEMCRLMNRNFYLLEASFVGMVYDGCGDLELEIQVWEANFMEGGSIQVPDGRMKLKLKGVGDVSLKRHSKYRGVDMLVKAIRDREQGVPEDGARTIVSEWFCTTTSERETGSRFEEMILETTDFLLSVTFLEGEIDTGREVFK